MRASRFLLLGLLLAPASPALAQIPGTSVSIDKTPILGGTSGRCLYDNSGKIGEQVCAGAATSVTVGSTTVGGGTTTRVLFDNAGVLGEYTSGQLSSFLGLGTAATQNTGTSGAVIPLLSTANTWSLAQTFTLAPVFTDAPGTRTALGLGTAATQGYTATSWTPTYIGSGTAGTGQTYSVQVGSYEQIGRQVTVRFNLGATSLGTAAGNLLISGLPVAAANVSNDVGVCAVGYYSVSALAASAVMLLGFITANTSTINLYQGTNTGAATLTVAQAGANVQIAGMCTYRAS